MMGVEGRHGLYLGFVSSNVISRSFTSNPFKVVSILIGEDKSPDKTIKTFVECYAQFSEFLCGNCAGYVTGSLNAVPDFYCTLC